MMIINTGPRTDTTTQTKVEGKDEQHYTSEQLREKRDEQLVIDEIEYMELKRRSAAILNSLPAGIDLS